MTYDGIKLDTCISPRLSQDFTMIDGIICQRVRAHCELFLELYADEIGSRSEAVINILARIASGQIPFDAAWSAEFGLLFQTLSDWSTDPAVASIRALLKLSQYGVWSDWACDCVSQATFRFEDCVIPQVDFVTSTVLGRRLKLSFCRNRSEVVTILIQRHDNRCELAGVDRRLPSIKWRGRQLRVIEERNIAAVKFRLNDLPSTTSSIEGVKRSCLTGLSLLDHVAPEYGQWISFVVRDVIPLSADQYIRSQSSSDFPGVIALSLPAPRTAVAEMLVHEASHQYLYILDSYESMYDSANKEYAFSPIKGTQRPLSMIVLAYHAFANIVLYYHQCLEYGIQEEDVCLANLDRHLPEINQMQDSIFASRGLTDAGRRLLEPLAALVADLK